MRERGGEVERAAAARRRLVSLAAGRARFPPFSRRCPPYPMGAAGPATAREVGVPDRMPAPPPKRRPLFLI